MGSIVSKRRRIIDAMKHKGREAQSRAGSETGAIGVKDKVLQNRELTTKFPSRYRVLSCICLSWVSDSPPADIVEFRALIAVTWLGVSDDEVTEFVLPLYAFWWVFVGQGF